MSPQLPVAGLDRSIEFYTNNLGFKVSFRYEDFYAGNIKDGYSVHLKLASTAIEERKNSRNNEHLDITVTIDDVDSLYKNIQNNQVEIIQPLREMPYRREFYIADPDGCIIAFMQEM